MNGFRKIKVSEQRIIPVNLTGKSVLETKLILI